MVAKKDVIMFVEKKYSAALKAVKEEYMSAVKVEEDRIASESGVAACVHRIERALDKVHQEHAVFADRVGESAEMTYSNDYRTLGAQLNRLGSVEAGTIKCINFENGILTKLEKNYNEITRGVNANYAAVLEEVKNKTNAKRAIAYLKEIGFDVSELEQMEHTEIATKLDTRYLFVGGNKKGVGMEDCQDVNENQ